MRSFAVLAASVAAAFCLAAPASAQIVPEGGIAPQEVADWLTGLELTPQLNDADGDAYIQVEADGLAWTVSFFDCEAGRCGSLQYTAGFANETITPEMVNRWNLERRYLKAYYRADGPTAVVQYDARIRPGDDIGQLADSLRQWAVLLPDFATHVGYFAPPEEGAE